MNETTRIKTIPRRWVKVPEDHMHWRLEDIDAMVSDADNEKALEIGVTCEVPLSSDNAENHGVQGRKSHNHESQSQIHKETPRIGRKDAKREKGLKSNTSVPSCTSYDKVSSNGHYRVGDLVELTKGRSGIIRSDASASTEFRF